MYIRVFISFFTLNLFICVYLPVIRKLHAQNTELDMIIRYRDYT